MKNIDVVKNFYKNESGRSSNGNLVIRFGGGITELVNYRTVIAYMEDDIVYLNVSKYSSTTSTIQAMLIAEGAKTNHTFKLYYGG